MDDHGGSAQFAFLQFIQTRDPPPAVLIQLRAHAPESYGSESIDFATSSAFKKNSDFGADERTESLHSYSEEEQTGDGVIGPSWTAAERACVCVCVSPYGDQSVSG